jgi:hypothetical protein
MCLQGSSWSRSKLKFVTHDSSPPTLSTRIAPGDVEGLQQCLPEGCLSSSSSSSSRESQHLEKSAAAAAAAGPVIRHSGEYVLYFDSSKALTVVQGTSQRAMSHSSLQSTGGLSVQLPAAGSDVVTVAPLLELQSSSNCSSSSAKLAVIGLTNMLNPGGAVKNVSIGSSSSSSRTAGSDGGSSSHSSDSWVVAEGHESAVAAAAGTGNGQEGTAKDTDAAAITAAAGDAGAGAVLNVSLLGCGQLLVYASCSPTAVLLDGRPVTFAYDSSSCSLVVEVSAPAGDSAQQIETHDLQHSIVLRFG